MITTGSYILLISLVIDKRIQIGKLGEFDFAKGYYLYSGSALGGLRARIKRHLAPEKKLHWHIDFLLTNAKVEEIWVTYSNERLECELARVCMAMPEATVPVKGFGSSDCRCFSHLVHFTRKLDLTSFEDVVRDGITLERLSVIDRR